MTNDDQPAEPVRSARSAWPTEPGNRADNTLGSGIESGIVLLIFAGVGWLLDSWLDTRPIFTLGLFVLGAVGLFFRYKAAYTLRMDELEAERRRRMSSDPQATDGRA